MITKTIDLHFEDFLEKLNEALDSQEEIVIESPTFPVGSVGGVNVDLNVASGKYGHLSVWVWGEESLMLRSIRVKGECGNLTFDKDTSDPDEHDEGVYLASFNRLKEAMITSGNHNLKLQLKITFEVEMETDNSQWTIPSKKPRLAAETLMTKISDDKSFTDFTLESEDGTKFPCHRILLAVQSSVFRRMFLSSLEEKKPSSLKLEYKTDLVEKFVKFFYQREIEEEEEGSLRSFLELAEMYDIPHLKEEVEQTAIRKLSVENMVDMFLLADFYTANNLKKAAEDFIKTNREKVKEGFDELDTLEKSQLMKLMSIFID